MAEFKAIETQEALDAIIKERIERNTRTTTEAVRKQYEGWVSPGDAEKTAAEWQKKIADLTEQLKSKEASIADLTAKNAAYELAAIKRKVADELGIPAAMADRLTGASEEDIRKDGETMARFVTIPQATPQFSGETPPTDSGDAALMQVLQSLKE